MNIAIEKLKVTYIESLYEFEIENRTFFEEMVLSRGDDYYIPEVFKVRNESLLDEQVKGLSFFYLIKDENNSILGRINLVDIDSDKIGFLGYRVGKIHTGKGIAKKALKFLLIMGGLGFSVLRSRSVMTAVTSANSLAIQ